MVVAWLLYPLIALLVANGCGLCVEMMGGHPLPGVLVPSLGLALVILVATITTIFAFSAPATPWIVLAIALLGYGLGWRRLSPRRLQPWTLALAAAVYLACAAPVVLSGNATWLGYFVDNDPAFHFVLGEQLLSHGRSLSNLTPYPYASPDILLHGYTSSAYPVGTDVALAATARLAGQNIAWVLQPFLAVFITLGAAALSQLTRASIRSEALRSLCCFTAALTGMVYAFYLEASLKEIATAWLLTVAAVLVVWMLERPVRPRSWLALVLVILAGIDVLAVAGAPWFAPPVVALVVALGWRGRHRLGGRPSRRTLAQGIGGLVVVIAIAVPAVIHGVHFLQGARVVLTASSNLGNLATRLPILEQFGIWPIGDFRWPVAGHIVPIHVLIAVAFAAALVGTAWCLRRRHFGPLLLILGNSLIAAALLLVSSPYAAAKVMMIFATSVTLASMFGAVALHQSRLRPLGWALAVLITGGVIWTDALGYRDASIAPRGRYQEMAAIGRRFNGQGPAFINVYDEYAVWFLRGEAVHVPSTWGETLQRPGQIPRTAGQASLAWDPNDLLPSYLQSFRLLVLARSPQTSRPPADYRLVYQDRYYDVWRRTPEPTVLSNVPLTSATGPTRSISCPAIIALGRRARREDAQLAYAPRALMPTLDPASATHPASWVVSTENGEGDPDLLHMTQGPGTVTGQVPVSRSGRYEVWLEGSISEPVSVWVGRRHIGVVSSQLSPPGQAYEVGSVDLHRGPQPVALYRTTKANLPGDVFPGYAGTGELLGPLTLVPEGTAPVVREAPADQARRLCGGQYDWLEIVRR